MPAAASAMSGECAATLTGSTMPRRAPRSLAAAAAASTAARCPLMTIWPGELRLATVRMPAAAADGHQLLDALVGQADDGGHGAIARGGLHEATALADEAEGVTKVEHAGGDHGAVLAHGVAGVVGRRPRGAPGRRPSAASSARCAAIDAASRAGCALTVRSSCSAGPSQASLRERLAEGLVSRLQTAAASGDAAARALPMPTDCEPWPG